eukprot:NODE_3799_length_1983_cov_10.125539.p1 GENE.NODE_3799_length_1983_cov_10.125539~~NODE_3799_length_1983_cov_10.125539.p1  ORF type:complete len:593 (+),score=114.51 NODE_3799_length_1983_cov_10.125539:98-1780(+)
MLRDPRPLPGVVDNDEIVSLAELKRTLVEILTIQEQRAEARLCENFERLGARLLESLHEKQAQPAGNHSWSPSWPEVDVSGVKDGAAGDGEEVNHCTAKSTEKSNAHTSSYSMNVMAHCTAKSTETPSKNLSTTPTGLVKNIRIQMTTPTNSFMHAEERGIHAGTLRHLLLRVMNTPMFEMSVIFIVLAYAANLGVQTDYVSRKPSNSLPASLHAIETAFCVFFVIEMVVKLYVYRKSFFYGSMRYWNMLDLMVVMVVLFEPLVNLVGTVTAQSVFENAVLSRALRVFRIVRLVRITGLGKLRKLIRTMASSLHSVGWAGLMMLFWIYIFAVIVTSAVSTYRVSPHSDAGVVETLEYYYGTLPRTLLSVYQAVSGGEDWRSMSEPLLNHVSVGLGILFVVFVFSITLVMVNVVAGSFVDNTIREGLEIDRREKEARINYLCTQLDLDNNGAISLDEFSNQLNSPTMRQLLDLMDLNLHEAEEFFQVIAGGTAQSIAMTDLRNGCVRLQKPPTRADLLRLHEELEKLTMAVDRGSGGRVRSSLTSADGHSSRRPPTTLGSR